MESKEINLSQCPEQAPVSIFNPEGNLIIVTNQEHILSWVRLQIAKQALHGYYIIFNGEKYEINHYGVIENWPDGLFTYSSEFATGIIRAAMDTKAKEDEEQGFEFWKRSTNLTIANEVIRIIEGYIHESYDGDSDTYPTVYLNSTLIQDLEIDSRGMVELSMRIEQDMKFPEGIELPELPFDPNKDYTVFDFCKHIAKFIHQCEKK